MWDDWGEIDEEDEEWVEAESIPDDDPMMEIWVSRAALKVVVDAARAGVQLAMEPDIILQAIEQIGVAIEAANEDEL